MFVQLRKGAAPGPLLQGQAVQRAGLMSGTPYCAGALAGSPTFAAPSPPCGCPSLSLRFCSIDGNNPGFVQADKYRLTPVTANARRGDRKVYVSMLELALVPAVCPAAAGTAAAGPWPLLAHQQPHIGSAVGLQGLTLPVLPCLLDTAGGKHNWHRGRAVDSHPGP